MSDQRYLSRWWGLALLLAALLQLAACSDSTSPSSYSGLITGSVIDQAGNPIEGSSILVSFRPSFEDVLVPEKTLRPLGDMPPPSPIYWIRLTNACGDTIRTLCEDGCSGVQTIIWDGLDDAGLRAVEGVYWFVLARADTTITQEMVLIHHYTEWNTEDCQAHARTSSDGLYSLNDACLGFGEMITVTDEEGNIVDERPLSRLVNLRAVSPSGSVARKDSVWFPASGSRNVDFVLPE